MIAYHYPPPYIGSSGIQRTLRFTHDLTAFKELLSPLEESERIGPVLVDFLNHVQSGVSPASNCKFVESASRESKAKELAALFNTILSDQSTRHNAAP